MSNKAWQVSTVVAALVAVGVSVYAFTQHSAVTALTAQLATAAADAKQAHETASSLSAQLAATTKDAAQAHAEAAGLQNQVQTTEAQASAEEAQLQTTEEKLASEKRPDLPVNLSFRKGLMSQGLVGVFRNTSAKEVEFTLDLESPATGRRFHRAVVLNPNGLFEVGAREGWAFAPGQRISLNNPAFRPVVRTVGG
jgi:septal ring factor EnvC (AmiA/AmiB activator)